jgi:hypothetical protein
MDRMNWDKVKIPSFGMSDAMVKYKNGTLRTDSDEPFETNPAKKSTKGNFRRKNRR